MTLPAPKGMDEFSGLSVEEIICCIMYKDYRARVRERMKKEDKVIKNLLIKEENPKTSWYAWELSSGRIGGFSE